MYHSEGFWVQSIFGACLCSVINIEDYFLFDIERSVLLYAPADGALQLLQWAPVPMTRCPWQRNSHTLPRPVSIFSPKTQIGGFPKAYRVASLLINVTSRELSVPCSYPMLPWRKKNGLKSPDFSGLCHIVDFARQLGNHQLPLCVKRRQEWGTLSCDESEMRLLQKHAKHKRTRGKRSYYRL